AGGAFVSVVAKWRCGQQRGGTLLRLGRKGGARRAFVRMRRLAPNGAASHVNGARAQRAAGDVEGAAVSLLRAITLDERDEDVWNLLADVYGDIDGGGCALVGRSRLDERCPIVRAHLCEAYGGLVQLYRDAGHEPLAAPFKEKAERLGCAADEQNRVHH